MKVFEHAPLPFRQLGGIAVEEKGGFIKQPFGRADVLDQDSFRQELELDPHNILATYKLGALEVEKGDGAKGKQLIEAAQKEKPDLDHIDYNLGRAEILLNNEAAAANDFERAVKIDKDPEVIEQAWFQLGTAYRRLHRMDEARSAMATYQQLKDEGAKKSEKALETYRQDHPDASTVSPAQSPQ